MTGYTVHTGSNEQFSGGWDRVFGGKAPAPAAQPKPTAVKKAVKKSAPASPKKRAR